MRLRNRRVIRLISRVIAFLCRCLYSTCRIRVIEGAPQTSPYAPSGDNRYVYCTWHDGILNSLFCGPVHHCAALTSRHADGEYVAEVMNAVGIHPVRGSNGNGGAAAAKQLIDAARDYHIVVTTDGPRGPRRTVKPGIIFLASQTGRPIVPVACSAKKAWYPKGRWTDLLVPRPFTRVYVLGGEPMHIPADVRRDQLNGFCKDLQSRMDLLQERADRIAAGLEPVPANSETGLANAA
ncbi:lysophospholipid acyltransferase family protein [Planctomicrobium sp. SH668]|uniref:lysophospholipid acyltransferase family protein n=1 Tax=Planctomicrobium sp. SH668 TaxID=3448126 RepID=UPI003F5BE0D1